MKLVRSQWYGSDPAPVMSIEAAVVKLCNGNPTGWGELIGRLVEKLHERGVLDEDAVLEILDWRFRKVEES